MEWFKQARFGLFMHYGVYSILGRGEWVQLREAIPVKEYEKLKGQFDADKHLDAAEVVRRLRSAQEQGCNMPMNTGPLPDGSIHEEDVKTLAETGRLLRG